MPAPAGGSAGGRARRTAADPGAPSRCATGPDRPVWDDRLPGIITAFLSPHVATSRDSSTSVQPMAHFSCFPGASALSDFRQTRLLDTLRQIDANIVAVRGQF